MFVEDVVTTSSSYAGVSVEYQANEEVREIRLESGQTLVVSFLR